MPAISALRPITIVMMSRDLAPSAMRTPISRERAETVNASSPWMPMAASRNATAAKAPSTRSCTTRGAVSSDDDVLERLNAGDRQLRIRARLMIDRTAGISVVERHGRTDHQVFRGIEAKLPVAHLRCRHVDLRLALALEAAHPDVADHADDRPHRERDRELLADRIAIGKVLASKRFG